MRTLLATACAFGAIAAVVGATGWSAIGALVTLMFAFYLTCALFIVGILGTLLYLVTRVNLLSLLRYLARLAVEQGCGRFEWSVLDWNQPAIDFYRAAGARPMDQWTVYRMDGQALADFARG